MNDTMDVSIIIANYNTCDLLIECIKSVNSQTSGISFEIIVVDNASQDNSCERIREELPDIKLIVNKENLGFGKANNIGIEHSVGKYIFLLNSDTLLINNAIKYFFDFCEHSSSSIGALGAILQDRNGNNVHSYGKFVTPCGVLFDMISKYLRFLKDRKYYKPASVKKMKEVDYITGADLFIPRTVCEKVGLFDPRFFMYCEEVDWQYRMYKAGYKRIIIDGPIILHFEGGSADSSRSRVLSNRLIYHSYSTLCYIQKYTGNMQFAFFRLVYGILWLPLLFILKSNNAEKRKCFLKMLFITKVPENRYS
jgi:GT2 family glycosyltransferase